MPYTDPVRVSWGGGRYTIDSLACSIPFSSFTAIDGTFFDTIDPHRPKLNVDPSSRRPQAGNPTVTEWLNVKSNGVSAELCLTALDTSNRIPRSDDVWTTSAALCRSCSFSDRSYAYR
uniref:Uncharacterized protein n=1 Tax=Colletotrichum fructicola (strain Nara gc5) TaxID=1213859 RepID=L2G7S7_COLFN